MAKRITPISGDLTKTVNLAAGNKTYQLAANSAMVLGDAQATHALGVDATAAKVKLAIKGDITTAANQDGIRLAGASPVVLIDKASAITAGIGVHALATTLKPGIVNKGAIQAETGIQVDGAETRARISNLGTIDATKTGISAVGDYSRIVNNGTITVAANGLDPAAGIEAAGRFTKITNNADGEISAKIGIVSLAGHVNETVQINNKGEITGTLAAISSVDANIEIVNKGTITGDILLGKGDDIIDLRTGTFNAATITGGKGDDLYRLSATAVTISEALDGGNDTVEVGGKFASGATFTLGDNFENLVLTGRKAINGTGNDLDNQIDGNNGNNTLKGGAGNDIIDGWKGKDTMTGDAGMDTFVFGKGSKKDVVTDFTNGEDHIELQGFKKKFDSFSEIMDKAFEIDGDVVFKFSKSDWLTVDNATKAIFDETDFSWF